MIKPKDLFALAEQLGGIPLLACFPGSPSARAGLQYGDILLAVNGEPVPNVDAYVSARRHDSKTMRVRIFRRGVEMERRLEFGPSRSVSQLS